MRTIAEGLPLAATAGTPPVTLAGFNFDGNRRFLRDCRVAHYLDPYFT
jgi:hypothetical protein